MATVCSGLFIVDVNYTKCISSSFWNYRAPNALFSFIINENGTWQPPSAFFSFSSTRKECLSKALHM